MMFQLITKIIKIIKEQIYEETGKSREEFKKQKVPPQLEVNNASTTNSFLCCCQTPVFACTHCKECCTKENIKKKIMLFPHKFERMLRRLQM